jgi:receptor expression-enhancing protein 5/6
VQVTKQPRIYIVLALAAVASLIIIQLLGLSFISNLFGFVPIYASFKALRSPEKEDDEFWLTYWVVYGSLGLFESFIDTVFFWMPFYFIAKSAFLVWAYAPQTKVSTAFDAIPSLFG